MAPCRDTGYSLSPTLEGLSHAWVAGWLFFWGGGAVQSAHTCACTHGLSPFLDTNPYTRMLPALPIAPIVRANPTDTPQHAAHHAGKGWACEWNACANNTRHTTAFTGAWLAGTARGKGRRTEEVLPSQTQAPACRRLPVGPACGWRLPVGPTTRGLCRIWHTH